MEQELKSLVPVARQQAVIEAIGRIGGERARQFLKQQAESEEGVRVLACAGVLGAADAKLVVPGLLRLLQASDESQRAAAVGRLAALAPAEALDHIVPLLQDSAWSVRRAAALAVGASGHAEMVRCLVPLLLEERDGDVREAAAVALGELRSRAAIVPLVQGLKDQTSPVRKAALRALEKTDPDWTASREARNAIEELASFLDDKNPDVRYAVAELLRRFGLQPPESPYYAPDLAYFYEIQQSLGVAQEQLDPDGVERRRKLATSLMIRMLGNEQLELRLAAALALGRLGNPRALPALQSALLDKELAVRQAAEGSILRLKSMMKKTALAPARGGADDTQHSVEAKEIVLCAGTEEVLFTWQCKSLERRLGTLKQAQRLGLFLRQNTKATGLTLLAACSAAEHIQCRLSEEEMLFVRCTLPLTAPCSRGCLFASCPEGPLVLGSGNCALDEVIACDAPAVQAICVISAGQVSALRCLSFISPEQMQQVAMQICRVAESLEHELLGCRCFCWTFSNTRLLAALHPAGEVLVVFMDPGEPDLTQPLLRTFLNSPATASETVVESPVPQLLADDLSAVERQAVVHQKG